MKITSHLKRVLQRWTYLLVGCVALTTAQGGLAAVEGPVQLKSGKISGVGLDSGVQVFRGIPFAAPPVGDLRWQAPKAPIPWGGVLAADTFGATCMQRGQNLMSEDCLYLNVWTNADSATENLPVMVWIHGGGWAFGASSGAIYDGEAFAQNGVILVSVNYRMSGFGFMAHPALSAESDRGVSGNYGILDHIAALNWVRDNIAGFGGDPGNVTIFGESAGGASIYALLATPLAKGLFHRAISESTWITPTNVTHLNRHNGLSESAESLGEKAVAAKLAELDQADSKNVLSSMREMSAQDVLSLGVRVSLTEDGWVFPKSAAQIFAEGSHNVVPLIAGSNNGEGLLFVRKERVFKTVTEQRTARETEFAGYGGKLLDYYVADSDDDIWGVEVDYNSDMWFVRPTRELVRSMARTDANSFMYSFTRNRNDPSQRSPHAAELAYVFNNLPDGVEEVDQQIAQLVNDYWVQFAKTGNPNREGLPAWPAYAMDSQLHQEIGAEVEQGSKLRASHLDELDRYLSDRYASAR
jgi:para-nitrobenzyl esterase